MKRVRSQFITFCILLALLLTTMLYVSQWAESPLVQLAFADPVAAADDKASGENTLGNMVGSQINGVAETAKVEALVSVAENNIGARYVRGGRTPSGFDCSGLVQYCAGEALGIELPRTSYSQAQYGIDVPMDQLQRGDILFWGSRGGAHHVGIYVGDNTYIHAAGRGEGVCYSTFDTYKPSFAKRII
ncbi:MULTISPECIES: C40 family peptidase [unclassified Adlercreutzia]|uniref:C40 family peptidase n=1 Tax=unclassified Adlercreutzia TaxID=2636013 RepID=UPI001F1556B2|nr:MULTISPECIES: C40 family peptidase [unclassified Adlercreutzia]